MFTERFGDFKPPEHNLLGAPIAETVFEPKVGGHIYDRGVDGSECRWARVLAYEPPDRVVFSWDISPQWQIETDPDNTSEVEVTFIAETPHRTKVELEHRHIDRHGPGWQAVSDGVAHDAGMAALPEPLRRPIRGGQLNATDHDQHRGRPARAGRVRLRHRPHPLQRVAAGRRRRPHGRDRHPQRRDALPDDPTHRRREPVEHLRDCADRPAHDLGRARHRRARSGPSSTSSWNRCPPIDPD